MAYTQIYSWITKGGLNPAHGAKVQPRPGSPEWFAAHGITAGANGKPVASASSAQPGATGDQAGPPVDPALLAQQNQANTTIGLGNAWDTYQTGQINANFGNLDNPAADAASNPYSQAALAYKRYNESQAGTNTSYAAAGHLYSGSLQNATEANAGNYAQTLAGLRQQRQGQLDGITKGSLDRYSTTGATLDSASLSSLMKLLGQG
jgi:hypothetical protein